MRASSRKTKLFFTAACLSVLVAVLSGCTSSLSKISAASPSSMSKTGQAIRSFDDSTSDYVVKDYLAIVDPSQLKGKLPPVKPEVITHGNTSLKRVALTLDDGWNPDMRILTLLKNMNIKFTTFLIAGRGVVDAHPEFVRAIEDADGEVCSHTYDHYVMRGKDEATVMMEIYKSQELIAGITHKVYPYMRFSGGAYDQPALDWTAREGYWVVNWSATDNDTAKNPSVDSQVNTMLAGLAPGAIYLCHWGGHNTYEVLSRVLPEIQRRGYEITSLTGVFEGTPYLLKEPPKKKASSSNS
jgi:peptidoglycan/xylan/chitin deacetylase (PgdA/CDA1 family)